MDLVAPVVRAINGKKILYTAVVLGAAAESAKERNSMINRDNYQAAKMFLHNLENSEMFRKRPRAVLVVSKNDLDLG